MLVIKQFGPVTYAMGTLQEILAGTGIAAKVRALPNDVAGCTLEMGADGKWVGTLGSLSEATADALYASGALANLATGATYRDTNGTQHTYSAGAGWINMNLAYAPSTALGPNLYSGIEAQTNKYLDDDGVIKPMDGYAVSNPIPVQPGDKLILALGLPSLNKYGGYFSGATWVSKIAGSDSSGYCTVPTGCDNIVITTAMPTQSNFSSVFVRKVTQKVGTKAYASVSSIGDSICRGFKATNPFTSVVAERLGIATIDNNGIDSSTIAQSEHTPISARMGQLAQADLVLFEGGGNDFNMISATLGAATDTTNTTFYGALFVCAEYLRKNFPLSTVVWVSCPRWSNWATLNANGLTMDEYMAAFKEIALRYGFAYADCYNQMSNAVFPASRVIASDYAHPTDIGHQQIADIIMRAIGR